MPRAAPVSASAAVSAELSSRTTCMLSTPGNVQVLSGIPETGCCRVTDCRFGSSVNTWGLTPALLVATAISSKALPTTKRTVNRAQKISGLSWGTVSKVLQ